MDVFFHILPCGSAIPAPTILPFVGTIPDVDHQFASIPKDYSMLLDPDGVVVVQDGQYDQVTALLQSWLILGVLDTFLRRTGAAPRLEHLIVQNDVNGKVIDLMLVGRYIQNWRLRVTKQARQADWVTHLQYYMQVLKLAHENARMLDVDDLKFPTASLRRATTILAIKSSIRAFLIGFSVDGICAEEVFTERFITSEICDYTSPAAKLAKDFLVCNGCCPVHAQILLESEEIEQIYIAAAIKKSVRSSLDHAKCTTTSGCMASSIDFATFTPRHFHRGCGCSWIDPDMLAVQSILQKGNIPLVGISRDSHHNYRLRLKTLMPHSKYTAISHVWSGGIASPRRNGMYTCQLSKLMDDLQVIRTPRLVGLHVGLQDSSRDLEAALCETWQYENEVDIWIDAFCIPCCDSINSQLSAALKTKAIRLMPLTYASASEVLVIEPELEAATVSIVGEQRLDQSAVRQVSDWLRFLPWMSRCWTLQEGILAQSLYARCLGLPLPIFMQSVFCRSANPLEVGLKSLLIRDTTQKDDLHQILANFCGLDASEVSRLPKSLRPQAFLRWTLPLFPIDILLQRSDERSGRCQADWWLPSFDTRIHFFDEQRRLFIGDEFADRRNLYQRLEMPECLSLWWNYAPRSNADQRHLPGDLSHTAQCRSRSYNAILHEQGIVIDPHPLGYISIVTEWPIEKDFHIQIHDLELWISLDLRPAEFPIGHNYASGTQICIILPSTFKKLNANGLVGRGLCLARMTQRTAIRMSGSKLNLKFLRHKIVAPAVYISALTCGVVTSTARARMSVGPLAVSSIDTVHDPFCIKLDVAKWPRLSRARADLADSIFQYGMASPALGALVILEWLFNGCKLSANERYIFCNTSVDAKTFNLHMWISILALLWIVICGSIYQREWRFRTWAQTFRDDVERRSLTFNAWNRAQEAFTEITYALWPMMLRSSYSDLKDKQD